MMQVKKNMVRCNGNFSLSYYYLKDRIQIWFLNMVVYQDYWGYLKIRG